MGKPTQPCEACGGVKAPGAGQRYCATCSDARKAVWQRAATQLKLEKAAIVRAEKLAGGARPTPAQRKALAPEGTKWCPSCGQYLAFTEFGGNGGKGSGLASYCKECNSFRMHSARLKAEYGITLEDYQTLMELQGGKCAICLQRPRKKRLAVDHNHKTGEIRGLLCRKCNQNIVGCEDPARLRRGAAYLEEPPAQNVLQGRGKGKIT